MILKTSITSLLLLLSASIVHAKPLKIYQEDKEALIFESSVPENEAVKELSLEVSGSNDAKLTGQRFALIELVDGQDEKIKQIRRISENSKLIFENIPSGTYRLDPIDDCLDIFAFKSLIHSKTKAGSGNLILKDEEEDKTLLSESLDENSNYDLLLELRRVDENRGENVKNISVDLVRLDDNDDTSEDKTVDNEKTNRKGLVKFKDVPVGLYRVEFNGCLALAWIPPTTPIVFTPIGATLAGATIAGVPTALAVGLPALGVLAITADNSSSGGEGIDNPGDGSSNDSSDGGALGNPTITSDGGPKNSEDPEVLDVGPGIKVLSPSS